MWGFQVLRSWVRGTSDGTSDFGVQKRSQAADTKQDVKQRGWETNRRRERAEPPLYQTEETVKEGTAQEGKGIYQK